MGAAGPYLRSIGGNAEYSGGYAHWCPACEEVHAYQVPRWTFNGDLEKPSFTPSMLIRWGERIPDQEGKHEGMGGICHYFLTAGELAYCADSTHALAGKTVPLPKWPYAPGEYGGVEG